MHTQVDYYDMLLVREVRDYEGAERNWTQTSSNETQKAFGAGLRVVGSAGDEDAGGSEAGGKTPPERKLFSRMKGDLSHESTYKRKLSRITMISKC